MRLAAGVKALEIAITSSTNLDWVFKGTGDFDGDGKDDILWQNRNSRALSYWKMNDLAVVKAVSLPTPGAGWTLLGVADFDGNGRPDILWRQDSTGQVAYWRMSGVSVAGATGLGVADPSWTFLATGKLGLSTTADILWAKPDGGVVSWRGGSPSALAVPGEWKVGGLGDVNGNGEADLLLSKSDGQVGTVHLFGRQGVKFVNLGRSQTTTLQGTLASSIPAIPNPQSDNYLSEFFGGFRDLPLGSSQKPRWWAHSSNGYFQVSDYELVSDNLSILQVEPGGRVRALAPGTGSIGLLHRGQRRGGINYNVVHASLQRLEIRAEPVITSGQRLPVQFYGIYSNGQRLPVAMDDLQLSGPFRFGQSGDSNWLEYSGGFAASAVLTATHRTSSLTTSATLKLVSLDGPQLSFDPPAPKVAPGQTVALKLQQTSTDGLIVSDATGLAQWKVTPAECAVVLPDLRRDGRVLIRGLKPGTATIVATDAGGRTLSQTIQVDYQYSHSYFPVGSLQVDQPLTGFELSPDGGWLTRSDKDKALYTEIVTRLDWNSLSGAGQLIDNTGAVYPGFLNVLDSGGFLLATRFTNKFDGFSGPFVLGEGFVAAKAFLVERNRALVAAVRVHPSGVGFEHVLLDGESLYNTYIARLNYTPGVSMNWDPVAQVFMIGTQRYGLANFGFVPLESVPGRVYHCQRTGLGWLDSTQASFNVIENPDPNRPVPPDGAFITPLKDERTNLTYHLHSAPSATAGIYRLADCPERYALSSRFSGDGQLLLSLVPGNKIQVFDAQTQERIGDVLLDEPDCDPAVVGPKAQSIEIRASSYANSGTLVVYAPPSNGVPGTIRWYWSGWSFGSKPSGP